MPYTTGLCIIGAASISAFPLFSGFISKSLIITATAAEGYWGVWLILLFASAGVFHHSGIKIPYFAFFQHDSGKRPKEAPVNMLIAMSLAAFLCIAVGVYPQALYNILPYEVNFQPYTTTHVVTQLQLLLFSALAFGWLMRSGLYPPELKSTNLDFDWSYRYLLPRLLERLVRIIVFLDTKLREHFLKMTNNFILEIRRYYGAGSWWSDTTSIGNSATLLVGFLVAIIIITWVF